MKTPLTSIAILILALSLPQNSNACTTFCLSDSGSLVFGRNYDFETGQGIVIINKRNVKKTAAIRPPEEPVVWVSKYGSLTFNQICQEFPHGGINEKGLVIEMMWLDGTRYPEIDERYGLTELQWIQYQLDNSSTVKEVIASDSMVRISSTSTAPLHFLICDAHGNAATIEFIDGKMVLHTGRSLPEYVLTNDTYDKSLKYLSTRTGSDGITAPAFTNSSLDRFVQAASLVRAFQGEEMVDYSFSILDSTSQGWYTRWQIVYDIKNLCIHYRTSNNPDRRSVRLADIDFSCAFPAVWADIDKDPSATKDGFQTCSFEANRKLIEEVCNNVEFLKSMPADARDFFAGYAGSTECVVPEKEAE